jgi:glycerophosphoryl diester phosphodiesterase
MAYTTAQLVTALLTVDGRAVEGGGAIELPPNARLLLDVLVEGAEPSDLLGDIAAAVAEAQAARDAAVDISGISTVDATVQAIVKNTGGAGPLTSAALKDAYAPKAVLSRQFQKPLYIAHRGGHLIHGEHSLEAYSACAQAGFAIEPDVQILSDGGLACIHDATTTRTMIQTAGAAQTTVASISSDAFVRDYRILPELAGSPYERPVLLPEVLDLFGGRVLIVPEMKDTATREAIVAEVKARGLEKAVLCQSFNFADVAYSAGEGVPSMYLSDTVGGVGATIAMVQNAGIQYIGASTAATQAYVDAMVAAGFKVVRWTMNQRNTTDVYLANNAMGIFTDDPWWTSGKFAQRYTDPYRDAVPWPHMLAGGAPAFCDGGYGKVDGTGAYTVAAQDWCPPIASGKARIDFEIVFKPFSTAQDRWVGIAFGLIPSENAYVDAATAGQEVVHCLIRRAGNLQVYRNGNTWVSGGPGVGQVAAAVQAAANAAAGMEAAVPFRFERTATEVRLTNRRTGEFVTWADTTAIYAGARFAFDNNGTDFVVRNVSVTPL